MHENDMIDVMNALKIEREKYPGWILPSAKVRRDICYEIKNINLYFGPMEKEEMQIRVKFYREVAWRNELVLNYDSNLFYKILSLITYLKPELVAEYDDEFKNAFVECMMYALWHSVLTFNINKFGKIRHIVLQYKQYFSCSAWNKYYYVVSLFYLYNLRKDVVIKLCKKWEGVVDDEQGGLWLASILVQIGDIEHATKHLSKIISLVAGVGDEKNNYRIRSIEGWALYLDSIISCYKKGKYNTEYYGRLQELEAYEANPQKVINDFEKRLSDSHIKKDESRIETAFEPNTIRYVYTSGESLLPRWETMLMCWQTGYIVRFKNVTPMGGLKNLVANLLDDGTLIRVGFLLAFRLEAKDVLDKYFTRDKVANLTEDIVNWLLHKCIYIVRENMECDLKSQNAALLELAFLVIGRIAFRGKAGILDNVVDLICQLIMNNRISYNVASELRDCWSGLFWSMDNKQLQRNFIKFLALPLLPFNDDLYKKLWADPFEFMLRRQDHLELSINKKDIQKYVGKLISDVACDDMELRSRAVVRLHFLYVTGNLNKTMQKNLANALWSRRDDDFGFPKVKGYDAQLFIYLPVVDIDEMKLCCERYVRKGDICRQKQDKGISMQGNYAYENFCLNTIKSRIWDMENTAYDDWVCWNDDLIICVLDKIEKYWCEEKDLLFAKSSFFAGPSPLKARVRKFIKLLVEIFCLIENDEQLKGRIVSLINNMKKEGVDVAYAYPIIFDKDRCHVKLREELYTRIKKGNQEELNNIITMLMVWAKVKPKSNKANELILIILENFALLEADSIRILFQLMRYAILDDNNPLVSAESLTKIFWILDIIIYRYHNNTISYPNDLLCDGIRLVLAIKERWGGGDIIYNKYDEVISAWLDMARNSVYPELKSLI